MRILINQLSPQEQHLVLHFGLGLIGTAISTALQKLDYKLLSDVTLEWTNYPQIAESFNVIESICSANTRRPARLSIVWSAGKSEFSSSQNEADVELSVFQNTLEFISELRKKSRPADFSFHFVSSAGGLFEGQCVIQKTSRPSPLRPYGKLKQRQEEYLLKAFGNSEITIYRPSSVYGPMTQKNRLGLINNLINNARNGRVTLLDAHVMSLRDYVFAGDIGNYIARQIRFASKSGAHDPIHFLVSAKCSSIFEVFQKINRILNLHAQIRYDNQLGNHRNITFSDNAMPPGWRPVALDVGIRQFILGR